MPINRIGQKVACTWPAFAWKLGCLSIARYPVENQAYTVAAFADTFGKPGIHLSEVPGFECACKGIGLSAWPLAAFRPVDERETDISALKDLLTPVPAAPERVDA
jgi:hypothetical protein